VAVARFNFPSFNPKTDSWPVYVQALEMAFKTRKSYTPAQKKEALILNLDPGLCNSLAARISPLDLSSPVVSYEYLVVYFDERYNSGLTESQAEQEFDNCYQGDLPIDDWVEKLNYLLLKCGWGGEDR